MSRQAGCGIGCGTVLALIVLAALALSLLDSAGENAEPTPARARSRVAPSPAQPTTYRLRYLVRVRGHADITYATPDGGTEQVNGYYGDWDKVYDGVPAGFVAVLLAQQEGSGEISCIIQLNGETWKQATSRGEYAICDVSGVVGR